jgi:16S rRNA (guanine527-N7)-methyltransferase
MQQFLQKHNLKLAPSQIEQFGKFLGLFMEYNSHTNLSAIRDEQGIIEKHFIDSLILTKFEDLSGKLLDIGSGGGFPGIPLKIFQPELDVTLLDSVGKKVNAMNHFVTEL